MVCWSAACVCLVVYLLQVIFEPEAFRVLILLVSSSQLFGTILTGGGSQHCLSPNNFHSTSECGPLGIQSPSEVSEVSPVKGTEENYWWNATSVKLEFNMENIVANLFIIPQQFFLLFKYMYSIMSLTIYSVYDVLHYCAIMPTSYLQSILFKQLAVLVLPCFYGLSMVLFSWLLVYYDSTIPGVFPPTPISPKKHRLQSGHTFHLGYLLGLINGIIVFGITLWQQMMH
ncbi:ADP-ribosylation factor-like protein 6-interacting protein 6 isoform X3 [Daphnia magna]|uniref:ADP-ribosylation factor-like protein 6-interacting protein 6 isoform X3 n=1 Tax=Daphnia magna TaxID=35525 RepID=UPI001E1BB4A0|nr:ADP-ribosylation factor-like protein 6-interacting protein 6 isoform X3 [Daphnia magna]